MTVAKQITIYVRGRKHAYNKEKISYKEVVDLGYPDGNTVHSTNTTYLGKMDPKKRTKGP